MHTHMHTSHIHITYRHITHTHITHMTCTSHAHTFSWFVTEPFLLRGIAISMRALVSVMLEVTTHTCASPCSMAMSHIISQATLHLIVLSTSHTHLQATPIYKPQSSTSHTYLQATLTFMHNDGSNISSSGRVTSHFCAARGYTLQKPLLQHTVHLTEALLQHTLVQGKYTLQKPLLQYTGREAPPPSHSTPYRSPSSSTHLYKGSTPYRSPSSSTHLYKGVHLTEAPPPAHTCTRGVHLTEAPPPAHTCTREVHLTEGPPPAHTCTRGVHLTEAPPPVHTCATSGMSPVS